MSHTFYDYDRTKVKFINILNEAFLDFESKLHLEELDCSKSFCRELTNKKYDEIIEIYFHSKFKCERIIHRQNHIENHLEISLSCTGNDMIEYFIFIELPIDKLDYYIKKYELVLM